MNPSHRAALRRSLSALASRRGILGGLTGGLIAAVPLDREDGALAKKNGKKKRKKKRKNKKQDRPVTRADATCPGPPDGVGGQVSGDSRLAQTFTALRTGRLVRAEIPIVKFAGSLADYILQLANVDAFGVPSNEVLAVTSIANVDVPDGESTIALTFANAAVVEEGTQYALVLTRPGSDNLIWQNRFGDLCPGRTFVSPNTTDPFAPVSADADFLFTTFVQS